MATSPQAPSSLRALRIAAHVVTAAAALLALGLRIDFGPTPEVTRFGDDAYYIFTWARSVAEGNGPCVTPGVPTTGLNLAWGALLAAVGWWFGTAAIPAAAQVIGLLCHAGFAAVAARLAGNGSAGLLVGMLALGNPWLLSMAQNGQETAAALFLLALVVAERRAPALRFFGLAVALLFTRSDAALFLLAVLFVRTRWPVAVGQFALLLLGHALVHVLVAGHPMQDSAAPLPWLFWQHELATYGGLTAERMWWWVRPVLLGGPYEQTGIVLFGTAVALAYAHWLPAHWIAAPLALTVLGLLAGAENAFVAVTAGALALVALRRSDADRVLTLTLLASVALVFVHVTIRHAPRDYYFALLAVPGLLGVGIWLRAAPAAGLMLVLAVAVEQGVAAFEPPAPRPWQAEMALAGATLADVLPAEEPVGCFHAGIVTWLREGPVVNLDGVVHRAAFAALRAAQLDPFLDAQRIRFLLDTPVQFQREDPWVHASGRWFGPEFDAARDLQPYVCFDRPDVDGGRPGTEKLVLYWRRSCRDPVPPRPTEPVDLGPGPGGTRRIYVPPRVRQAAYALRGGAEVALPWTRGAAHVFELAPLGDGPHVLLLDGNRAPALAW